MRSLLRLVKWHYSTPKPGQLQQNPWAGPDGGRFGRIFPFRLYTAIFYFCTICIQVTHVSRETWPFFAVFLFHGEKIPAFPCSSAKKAGKTVEMPGCDCYNGILQPTLCKCLLRFIFQRGDKPFFLSFNSVGADVLIRPNDGLTGIDGPLGTAAPTAGRRYGSPRRGFAPSRNDRLF